MTTPLGKLIQVDSKAVIMFTRDFEVSPDDLWTAIATTDGINAWLAEGTIDGGVGGAVHLKFDGDQTVDGQITEWDPPSRLTYEWTINGAIPSTITFTVAPTDGGSRLTLSHTGLPDEMAAGYTPGWHAYLDRLRQSIDGSEVQSWDHHFANAMPRYDTES